MKSVVGWSVCISNGQLVSGSSSNSHRLWLGHLMRIYCHLLFIKPFWGNGNVLGEIMNYDGLLLYFIGYSVFCVSILTIS
jgi:hypothetical protein